MPEPAPAFTGLVLAGGASRRLGADKAAVDVAGTPLVERPYRALVEAGAAELLSVGGDLAGLQRVGFDARPDTAPGEGPFGGLLEGLALSAHPLVVLLACDLPWADAPTVGRLVRDLAASGADAVVPVVGGRRQPLFASYRRSARSALAQAFADGVRSATAGLDRLRIVEAHGLPEPVFRDVDTPADLLVARESLR